MSRGRSSAPVDRDGEHLGFLSALVELEHLEVLALEVERLRRVIRAERPRGLLSVKGPGELRAAVRARKDETLKTAGDRDADHQRVVTGVTPDVVAVDHWGQSVRGANGATHVDIDVVTGTSKERMGRTDLPLSDRAHARYGRVTRYG